MHPDVIPSTEMEKEEVDASIDECIYDKIIDVLNNKFNPNQLEEFTKKLQSHTYSTLPADGRFLSTKGPPLGWPGPPLVPAVHVLSPPATEFPLLPPKPSRKVTEGSLTDKTLEQPPPFSTLGSSMLSLAVDPAPPTMSKTKRSMSVPFVEPLDAGKLLAQQSATPEKPAAKEDYEEMDSTQDSEQRGRRAKVQVSPPSLPPRRPISKSCEKS